MGISSWIAHKAVWNPQKIAIRFRDRELNYVAFEKRIAHLAAYLADEHGVRTGDRVAYLGLNSPELLYIFFACARLGAIFVPLNSRMTAEQISMLLANCEPRCMLVQPSFRPTATQAGTNCSDLRVVFLAGSNGSEGETLDVDRLVDNGRAMSCNPVQYQSEPVLIAYTSGTTGTPKGAVYTQDWGVVSYWRRGSHR